MNAKPDSPPLAVELEGVAKSFGQTHALRNVSLRIAEGETRGLIGRNGAGKSTLVSILSGQLAPDSGHIRLWGQPAPPHAQRASWRHLVSTVYQHSSLIESLTVAENLFVGSLPAARGGLLNWNRIRSEARRLLDEWGLEIPEKAEVSRLRLAERQLVEIARELALGAKLVILDEPTSRLARSEIERLYSHLRTFQQRGVTVLYISHHLEEVLELCHTVSVLRDGRHVATRRVADTGHHQLVADMVGELRPLESHSLRRAHSDRIGEVALRVESISASGLAPMTFEVRSGELLGVAGLVGSGKEVLAATLTGQLTPDDGRVLVAGQPLKFGSTQAAMDAGISYVPADRRREGLVMLLSVAENATMSITRRMAGRLGMIWPQNRRREAVHWMEATEIVAASPDLPVASLSGGNQQKVVIARAIAVRPKVLVLANPSTGVDVASKAVIYEVINRYRDEGMAIVLVSDELEEYALCDRVLVLFGGAVVREFPTTPPATELLAAVEGVKWEA